MAGKIMLDRRELSGKSVAMRGWLMTYWRLWEKGYRGPMPYVVEPPWSPPPYSRKSTPGTRWPY